jgi:hypothetical protein
MTCRACGLDHKPTVRCEQAKALLGRLVTKPVANSVTNVTNTETAGTGLGKGSCAEEPSSRARSEVARSGPPSRVQAWREKNRELYNERQRELMRKRRAGKKPLGIAHG